MIRIPIVARETDVPIRLLGFNRNPIKMMLKEPIAKMVE